MDKVWNRNDSAEIAQSGLSQGDLAAEAWHEMFAAAAEASRIASMSGAAEQAPQHELQNNNRTQSNLPRLIISEPSDTEQGSMHESANFFSLEQAMNQIGLHSLNQALRTQELSHETSLLDKTLLLAKTKQSETDTDNVEKPSTKSNITTQQKDGQVQNTVAQTSFTLAIGSSVIPLQNFSNRDEKSPQFDKINFKWNITENFVSAKLPTDELIQHKSNKAESPVSNLKVDSQAASESSFKGTSDQTVETQRNEHYRNSDFAGLERRTSRKNRQSKNSDLSGTIALQKANKRNEQTPNTQDKQLGNERQSSGKTIFETLKSPFSKSIFKNSKDLSWKDRGWKPAEQTKDRSKRRAKTEQIDEISKSTELEDQFDWTEKLKLEAIKKLPTDAAKQRFLSCLEHFRHKAAMKGMSPKEIEETCKQLSKLLEANEAQMPEEDRILAVESFILHLAFPDTCDQGHHNTCNVTTLAQRNIRRRPSLMAEVLKTTALTGSWVAPDGLKIIIAKSSLVPGAEEQSFPRAVSCDRTFATQILNNVLANDISQRRIPAEYYTQEKPQSIDDSGERLRYADGKIVPKEPPAVRVEELDAAQKRLTGESNFVIFNTYFKAPNDALVGIASPEQFDRVLKEMKEQDKLPAILYVDARHKAFGGEGKPNEQIPGAHVVSVINYDSHTQMVSIANQWGADWNRDYPLSELFLCTLPVEVSA